MSSIYVSSTIDKHHFDLQRYFSLLHISSILNLYVCLFVSVMFTVFAPAVDCARAQSFTSQIFRGIWPSLALLYFYYREVFQVEDKTAPKKQTAPIRRSLTTYRRKETQLSVT